VSFCAHGRAFCVYDVELFVAEIVPKYFRQSKWSSFCRQLNLYGFGRIGGGTDAGAYYHELFLRGKPQLSHFMRRVGVPGEHNNRLMRVGYNKMYAEPDLFDDQAMTRGLQGAS